MDRPLLGQPHSYIAQASAPYVDEYWRVLLRGRPSLAELRRAGREGCDVARSIADYCDALSSNGSVAIKVLNYLVRLEPLHADLQRIVDRKLREGLIRVPEEFLTYEGMKWVWSSRD